MIRQPTACDIAGTIRGVGQLFVADVKCSADRNSLSLSDDHLNPHQRDELLRHGQAGVVAGVIAFATHAELDFSFWVEWTPLGPSVRSIRWDGPLLLRLGKPVPDLSRRAMQGGRVTRADDMPIKGLAPCFGA